MFGFIVLLLIIGVILALVPIDAQIKRMLIAVLTVLLVLWLVSILFGFGGGWSRGRMF